MSSPAEQLPFVLVRRLADGGIEWISLEAASGRMPATPDAAYTLIERPGYEAPPTLQAERLGQDLVVEVRGSEVLVLEGFFATAGVAFYPTTDIASGAGPFSGSPLTPSSPVLAGAPAGEQVVWSAAPAERQSEEPVAGTSGGSSLAWVGVGAGVLGLAALAGGGGGSGGGGSATVNPGSGGSGPPPADTTPPQITSGPTASPIAENSGPGTVVYTTAATDAGTITYSLKADADAAAFSINTNTGAVTLIGNPDFETKSSYSFTVVARDGAGNSAEQPVSLSVTDVNDPAPSSVTITSGATAAAVNENSGASRVVYTVTANATGPLTYSLKAGGDAAAFSINANTGAVTLTVNPDHEAKSGYQFTVVATAGANSAEKAVSLAINDLDEAAPSITSGATANAINENSGAGRVVYTVTSTDTGDVSSGSTTYSLKAGGDAAAFTINANTGAVTLTANPNHETKSSYGFTVVATDAAGNRSERAVSLAINDVDDVAPTITSGATATTIVENTGAGQLVYTVTSTDTGDVSTGITTYSLRAGGDAAAFVINANTGAVTLTGNPDFETKASYSFTVAATDEAGNSSERAVSLQIVDLDDSPPSDTTPPTLSSTSPVDEDEDVPVGANIVLTFSENVLAGVDHIHINGGGGNNLTIDVDDTAQISISGNQVTINPTSDLNPDTNYDVRVDSGAFTDAAGNPFAGLTGGNTLEFRTEDDDDVDGDGLLGLSVNGSRTFQPDAGLAIEIVSDAGDAAASTAEVGFPSHDSVSFGSDDKIALVGNSGEAQLASAQMDRLSFTAPSDGSPASADAHDESAQSDPTFFEASLPDELLAGGGGPTNSMYIENIAPVIVTSQGLA